MDEFTPTSHSVMSQRLKLNYVDWGNHDAPLLVLLHGGRDHARNWDWVARELRNDWHVICPGLRGHGDSADLPRRQPHEDGSYSWKFDNYVRSGMPLNPSNDDVHELWHNIECPVWLIHGAES